MTAEINQTEPYQGLRPYEEKDQYRFFGRDAECRILIDKILANKLTLLFAASGVGKSSLLQAAVIPRLKDPKQENLDAVYYNDWVTPPIKGLKDAVLRYLKDEQYIDSNTIIEKDTLKDFLGFCALFTRQPFILILDQFEEFFRYQRHLPDYQPFLEQLAAAITDRNTPIVVVISMREDFALELNEFKPHLPTLLFENFYRLERLSKENARLALVAPLKQVGFRFEKAPGKDLLEALLTDLSTRELGQTNLPVSELIDTVEPAYLQIICSQLWALDKQDPEKTLRCKTYTDKGKAKGLLETYVKSIVEHFNRNEQRLASLAFNHLVTQRGVKMAYTPEALAKLLDAKQAAPLAEVLGKLEQGRILRSQTRQGEQWYELYHDLFSRPIEQWNEGFKTKERNRRAILAMAFFVAVIALSYSVFDGLGNRFNHHLRLSIKPEVSNGLEVYRGKADSPDLFKQQRYIAESGYVYSQIEPDKLFSNKPLFAYDQLNTDLITTLPLVERITAYWEDGQQHTALDLARKSISNDNVQRSQEVVAQLGQFRSKKAIAEIGYILKQGDLSLPVKTIMVESLSLGHLGRQEAVQSLLALLKDSNSEVRRSAADALGLLGSDTAVPPLLALLKNSDPDVRSSAADALARLGSDTAVPPLLAMLKDSNPNVRIWAADALGRVGSDTAVPPLLALLKDSDPYMRSSAAYALRQLGSVTAVPPLLALLKDSDPGVRRSAVDALWQLGSDTAVPPLLALLKGSDPYVGQYAAEALGRLGSDTAVPPLLALLKDSDPDVRRNAADALGQLGSDTAVLPLLALLKDSDPYVRLSAADALGRLGSDTAVLPVLALLKDINREVRSSAADILGLLGSDTAVLPLQALLKDSDTDVRRSAAKALGQLGSDTPVLPLLALLKDSDYGVRSSAAVALGQLGSGIAVPPLLALLKDNETNVRSSAAYALGQSGSDNAVLPLQALLKDSDTDVRRSAAKALGQLGSDTPVPPLLALLKDSNYGVRSSAAVALGQLGSGIAVPPLLALLKDSDREVRRSAADALGKLGSDTAVPPLLALLNNSDTEVRISAIYTLGRLGSDSAVMPLLALLNDNDREVRRSAAGALAELGSKKVIAPLIRQINTGAVDNRNKAILALAKFQDDQAIAAIQSAFNRNLTRMVAAVVLSALHREEGHPLLAQVAKTGSQSKRLDLIKFIGMAPSEFGAELLLGLLDDSNLNIKVAAMTALGKTKAIAAVPQLGNSQKITSIYLH